jgi:hypothetical protein
MLYRLAALLIWIWCVQALAGGVSLDFSPHRPVILLGGGPMSLGAYTEAHSLIERWPGGHSP